MFPRGNIKKQQEEANEIEHSGSRQKKLSAPTMDTVDMRDKIKSFNIELWNRGEAEFLFITVWGADIEIRWEHQSFGEIPSWSNLSILGFLPKDKVEFQSL